MIRTFLCKNHKVIRNIPLARLKKYLKERNVTIWADIQKGTKEEYKLLESVFNFHPLSMEDAKKSIELPKIELFDKYIFLVLHAFSLEKNDLTPRKRELDFFLGKNFLVTVHEELSPSIEHMIIKLEKSRNSTSPSPDFFMYEIIDYLVDDYFPIIERWEDYIETLETSVVAHKPSRNVLTEITSVKRAVLFLKRSVSPQRSVINRLTRREFKFIRPLTGVYFRDVFDHISRVYTELEIQRDLINTAFEVYMSVLTIQMTKSSNKMNEIMQKLTVIATIFMPLTFLAGVYGMNFRVMPELTWKYGYYVLWVIMIIIGVFMYWFFKKKRWA